MGVWQRCTFRVPLPMRVHSSVNRHLVRKSLLSQSPQKCRIRTRDNDYDKLHSVFEIFVIKAYLEWRGERIMWDSVRLDSIPTALRRLGSTGLDIQTALISPQFTVLFYRHWRWQRIESTDKRLWYKTKYYPNSKTTISYLCSSWDSHHNFRIR